MWELKKNMDKVQNGRPQNVYCISHYFRVKIAFLDFCGNSRGLISHFSDVVITINRHELKWKFSRGSGSRNSRK